MSRSDAVMVSSGDDQEMVLPLWLRSIKSAKLHCSCETHPSELRTFYCRVCGVAVCKECKEQHDRFNHEMIKAYKASKGPSFRRDDLEPLWDISGICPYRQDGNLVAYINKRGAGIACSRSQSGFGECESCQFGFKRQAKYCSVECKVEAEMKMNGSGTQTMTGGSAGYAQSFRKRPRKQKNPPRAPFY